MRDDYDRDIDKHTHEGPCWPRIRWIVSVIAFVAAAAAIWFKFG